MSPHPTEGNPDLAFPTRQPSSESRQESHIPPLWQHQVREINWKPSQHRQRELLSFPTWPEMPIFCLQIQKQEGKTKGLSHTHSKWLNLDQDSSNLTKDTTAIEKKKGINRWGSHQSPLPPVHNQKSIMGKLLMFLNSTRREHLDPNKSDKPSRLQSLKITLPLKLQTSKMGQGLDAKPKIQ